MKRSNCLGYYHSKVLCSNGDVQNHHVVKRRLGGSKGEVVALCPRHHKLADLGKIWNERGIRKLVKKGWEGNSMNGKGKEKLRWWKRFWPQIIIVCSPLVVLQCVLYLLGYIDLSQLCGGILLVFVAIPLTYGVRHLQIRYQTSKKTQLINKIAFIVGFGWIAWVITFFGGVFIIWAAGLHPPTDYLGSTATFIVLFVVPLIVGGFIGYQVGKRRNYRPYV